MKGGTLVEVECETVPEFTAVMSAFKQLDTPSAKLSPEKAPKAQETEAPQRKQRQTRAKHSTWNPIDLVGMAKIVKENTGLDNGLASMTGTYIRKLGIDRNRKKTAIYDITSKLKAYFNGKEEPRLGKKNEKVLRSAGLYPNPSTSSNLSRPYHPTTPAREA